MGSLVEVIARALVSRPDEVKVTEETDGKEILVKLQVADEDIGKIIGKSGRIAKQSFPKTRSRQRSRKRSSTPRKTRPRRKALK